MTMIATMMVMLLMVFSSLFLTYTSGFIITVERITYNNNNNNDHSLFLLNSRMIQQTPTTTKAIMRERTLSIASSSILTSSTCLRMCQLLGMNCATPTDFTFSLKGFCKRGGDTDIHSDGWGVAFYEGKGLRQFHDREPASTSPMATFLQSTSIQTLNMMSHLRYATAGGVELSNVHPFCREMWGINFAFAMNGDIPLFKHRPQAKLTALSSSASSSASASSSSSLIIDHDDTDTDTDDDNPKYYHPVGGTDSEAAFCAILNALRNDYQTLPSLPVLKAALQQLCDEIIRYDPQQTIMNFLLTCGPDNLWVYSYPGARPGSTVWNGLHYTTRSYPFSEHTSLCDVDYDIDFSTTNGINDCVSIIATLPLTDNEDWVEIQKGELIVFDQGSPHTTSKSLFEIELLGHGLKPSSVFDKPILENDMKQFDIDPDSFYQGSYI